MIFRNRQEAGQRLAAHLGKYANRLDAIVLGVPRGGVPIAFEVARALNLPLNVFVLRKLGVPGHEEFAFGASRRSLRSRGPSLLVGSKSIGAGGRRWMCAGRR